MKLTRQVSLIILFLVLTVSLTAAQNIPKASSPEEVGLSKERLQRVSAWVQSEVDKKVLPGAVVMILRKGKIAYHEAFGYQDPETKIPMDRNSIFRIASMTKPFVALATMMLVEEGKIALYAPVSQYLPEFKDVKVGIDKKDAATGKVELVLETPSRAMTIHDLLRHTSGITYGVFGAKTMVKELYNKANLFDDNQTNAEFITKISQLPLQYHPGTTFDYSMSYDVLGRVVEVASGLGLAEFIDQKIVKPLKLKDTGFWLEDAGRQARLAQPFLAARKTFWHLNVSQKRTWADGGGGMVSSPVDYARFCLMFSNGGTLDGVRLVSRKTVEYMISNHLPPGYKYSISVAQQIVWLAPSTENGQGYALGFGISTEPGLSQSFGSKGDYYWTGALGTLFWVDPKEELIAIMMTQAPGPQRLYSLLLRYPVYQAIVD